MKQLLNKLFKQPWLTTTEEYTTDRSVKSVKDIEFSFFCTIVTHRLLGIAIYETATYDVYLAGSVHINDVPLEDFHEDSDFMACVENDIGELLHNPFDMAARLPCTAMKYAERADIHSGKRVYHNLTLAAYLHSGAMSYKL